MKKLYRLYKYYLAEVKEKNTQISKEKSFFSSKYSRF